MADQNCTALEDVSIGCPRNSGGMSDIIVGDMEDVSLVTADEPTWILTAFDVDLAPISINVKRRHSDYTEEETNDLDNGSVKVVRMINATLPRREAAKSRSLKIMGDGQRYLYVLAKDLNGLWWYFPYAQLLTNGGGSGRQREDGSKYDIVFQSEDDQLAYEIPTALVEAALAVS
jgi:hypothetical protein